MKKRMWIIVGALTVCTIGVITGFIWINCNLATCNDRVTWADWLAAACTILSLVGTIFLSCVAITQTDKANQINDKLMQQNKQLQEITNLQAKLSNQEYYPIITAEGIKFEFSEVTSELDDCHLYLNNKKEYLYPSDFYNSVSYHLDCREQDSEKFYYKTKISFMLTNKSNAKISEIEIFRINSKYPLESDLCTTFKHNTILMENDSFKCDFYLYHQQQMYSIEDKITLLQIKLFMKIKLVTGVVFTEDLCITNAEFIEPHSNVDSLKML